MLYKMKWTASLLLFLCLVLEAQQFDGVRLTGVETFNPRKVPGITAWWRADYGVTIDSTTGTNTVSKVLDLSGGTNNLSQASKSSQPIYVTNNVNGYPVFQFTNQRRFLCDSIANLASGVNTPHTVFIVSNSDVIDANSPIICWANSTNNTPIVTLRGPVNGGALFNFRYTRNDDSATSFAPTTSGMTSNAWHICSVAFSGSSATLTMDTNMVMTAGSNGQTTISNFTIGMKHGTTFTNPWAGRLAEVIVYNTGLSTNEIQRIHAYLNSKYLAF